MGIQTKRPQCLCTTLADHPDTQSIIVRVSGRVVVVVVRELFLSRDVSDLCADQRSEVTKIVYHMTQVFRLLLRSHHREFVGTV